METKLTIKGQATIPLKVRQMLHIKPGDSIEWETVKGMVIVTQKKKITNPVRFLTSQVKLDIDAVKLVNEAHEYPA